MLEEECYYTHFDYIKLKLVSMSESLSLMSESLSENVMHSSKSFSPKRVA